MKTIFTLLLVACSTFLIASVPSTDVTNQTSICVDFDYVSAMTVATLNQLPSVFAYMEVSSLKAVEVFNEVILQNKFAESLNPFIDTGTGKSWQNNYTDRNHLNLSLTNKLVYRSARDGLVYAWRLHSEV
jgi:hypothetical protein